MKITKLQRDLGAGAVGTAMLFGGVDAAVMNETPLERVEMVAEHRVEAKQVGNRVETTLPWKDQKGLKVSYDMGEPTMKERLADKRKQEVVTEMVDFGDGGFKVDILLNEKPDTNRFCYTIEGAENYDFFYQGELTEEEIAEGAERPADIVGSYAVYHRTLKNHELGKENYATGKVMHIPRPQVWSLSDEENKEWADLSYADGELCVTVDEKWLARAEYPVRVDPTFGYTEVGGTSVNGNQNDTYAIKFTGEDGDVTSISFYTRMVSDGNRKGLIYSDDSSYPGSQLGVTASTAVGSTLQWYEMSFSSSVQVTATTLWLGVAYDGGGATSRPYYYDSGSTNQRYVVDDNFTTPADPYPAGGTGANRVVSIYATYTAAPSEVTPQSVIWFD